MADDALLESESPPERHGARRSLLAGVLDLLLPPLGHIVVGATRRGVAMWAIAQLVGSIGLIAFTRAPGLATALLMLAGLVALRVLLPLDAVRISWPSGSVPGTRARPWRTYVAAGLVCLAVGLVARQLVLTQVQAFRIPTGSMTPSLLVGDYMMVDKNAYRGRPVRRGDVIVFPYRQQPQHRFVMRAIGLPGETLTLRDKRVFVNDVSLDEPYVLHTDSTVRAGGVDPRDNFGPYTIEPGQIFVMGDNRENSNDSRFWGTVPERTVVGRAAVLYWSWDGEASQPRWDRVGMRIPRGADPAEHVALARLRGPVPF